MPLRIGVEHRPFLSMDTPDLLAALQPIVVAFEAMGVDYQIGGSVASSVYGLARATIDVDLVVVLEEPQVDPLFGRLRADYYVDGEAIHEAIQRRSSFNVVHLATMMKVDVFILRDTPYDRTAFARRRKDSLRGGDERAAFYLASAEDIVLHKLYWYRLGECVSDRQWGDLIGILKIQGPRLDRDYLNRWAGELDVKDLLDRALGEAVL